MEGHRRGDGDEVVVGGDARQRFHDARGYGRPLPGNDIALGPVEAAHLLARGDLSSVDGEGFAAFVADRSGAFAARFLVYADVRRRGFYLAPTRRAEREAPDDDADFIVFERGTGPVEGTVAHRVRAIGVRTDVPASTLGDVVLAVADEDGEVTYLETGRPEPAGSATFEPPSAEGVLLDDRVLVTTPPADLHRRGVFGQPLGGLTDGEPARLQLSLVEAAYLARRGTLTIEGTDSPAATVLERGRNVEGERFDRRLAVYEALRERGVVPKTGFKFGADFRTYGGAEDVESLGHSESLVRVLPPDHVFAPRELALDVRLAAGVRKRTVFALTDGSAEVTWLGASRLTP